jgi:hypothetical protein
MRKFRIFQFFFTQMTILNFWKQHKSTKFELGFRMVHWIERHKIKIKKFTLNGVDNKENYKKTVWGRLITVTSVKTIVSN